MTNTNPGTFRHLLAALVIALTSVTSTAAQTATAPAPGATPKVGEVAADFSLQTLDGKTVRLSAELARGPVVVLMMRGWPGYQCPFCTRQFGDFLANADKLKAAGATVIFVYPGPAEGLAGPAQEFTAGKDMPSHFVFLTDPDYVFTNAYGLRWDAAKETAYPSTFILNQKGVVTFAKTSRSHGDRVPAAEVLSVLSGLR